MMLATDWGSVPSWLGLAGVVVAAAAFVSGRFDAMRRPASMVFPIVTSYKYGSRDEDNHTTVRIENGSDMPAFECGISLYDWGRRRRAWRVRPHDNWMTGKRIVGRVYPTLLAHSETGEDQLPGLANPMEPDHTPTLRYVSPNVLLVFRDGNGRRWVRWPDGKLSRLRPSRSLPRRSSS